MKTMTCKQLGGACDLAFHSNTFDEIADLSQKHGTEMFKKGDKDHLEAMNKMIELMNNPEMMEKWFEEKKREYESLSED